MNVPSVEQVYAIFSKLNQIPRPSHHEEKVADFICDYARNLGLEYQRDANNCVVIRKAATPGYEQAEPIVVLNHMDMVCVGMDNPLTDPISPYIDNGWMKAKGTSLGADNGIGLSMALAMLADDSIVHGPIEVMTTTNEEDGMSGAAGLTTDFLRGRKVINLDSEDYDTITTGAAGAYLQEHRLPMHFEKAPGGKRRWFRITIDGGKGGHSGVDINKGRASAVVMAWAILAAIYNEYDMELASITVGEANAWVQEEYGVTDPGVACRIEKIEPQDRIICHDAFHALMLCLEQIPQGVLKMSDTMKDTVETSNNVGRIVTLEDHILITTHTRSFIDEVMIKTGQDIAEVFAEQGASSIVLMSAPAWQERQDSEFLRLTSDVFQEVLGWRPRPVAMHFVLEAGYFVQKYPGIEIASIGPRIVEPHSTAERVELSTIEDIWKVFIHLLHRLAES